jgi:hypothetical protein
VEWGVLNYLTQNSRAFETGNEFSNIQFVHFLGRIGTFDPCFLHTYHLGKHKHQGTNMDGIKCSARGTMLLIGYVADEMSTIASRNTFPRSEEGM